MSGFTIVRDSRLPPDEVWRRLTNWTAHGDHIPLTEVVVNDVEDGRPVVITARTSLGRWGFDDEMKICHFHPPAGDRGGVCRLVKRGAVVEGWAELLVEPYAGGTRITWFEDAGLRYVRGLLAWPTNVAGKRVFARLIDGLLADDAEAA